MPSVLSRVTGNVYVSADMLPPPPLQNTTAASASPYTVYMYPNADANHLIFRVDGLSAGAYTYIYEVRVFLAEAKGALPAHHVRARLVK